MKPRYGRIYGKATVKKLSASKRLSMRLTLCGNCDNEIIPGMSVLDAERGRVHPFCKSLLDAARKAPPKSGRSLKH